MRQYLDLLTRIHDHGTLKKNRTGVGTKVVFGHQLRFHLADGFPLVTTKKIHTKSIIHELLWMLSGSTNIKYLQDNKVRIWNEWADKDGELGPVYGKQWRKWANFYEADVDQIAIAIAKLRNDPDDRGNLVSAWNVPELPLMALRPCHCFMQWDVTDNRVSCQVYLRSWDMFLGGPFNIAQYALLTHMMAQVSGREVGDLVVASGDTHIYINHLEQVRTQINRSPRKLPTLTLNPDIKEIDDFRFEDVKIDGYDPHPHIAGEVAV